MGQRYSATRRFQFCAGHRVFMHESKCNNLHGHNYVALVTCRPHRELDELGRVVDFGVIKREVGRWIDENWDHGFILKNGDPLLELWSEGGPMEKHKHFVMAENPTAENMAALLKEEAEFLLEGHGVFVAQVRLWETENCYAEV